MDQNAVEGIAPTIEGLQQAGAICPTQSPWNTSILAVLKADKQSYRMAHDLRRINGIVVDKPLPVPNPATALGTLTPQHTWFTVIDLANVFFCLPLAEQQEIFAFTYNGQQYKRLPQAFTLTPGLFNQVLKRLLNQMSPLPLGVLLIQCKCTHLHHIGFKVNKKKVLIGRRMVTFLGQVLTADGTKMTPAQQTSILECSHPETVKEMLAFLGLINFSRHYIPDFAQKNAST